MRYDLLHSAVSPPPINWTPLSPVLISVNSQPVEAIYRKSIRKAKLRNHLNQIERLASDR